MPDSRGAGDPKADRPSFTGFWKRSKDKQAAQSLTFVSSKLGQPSAHGGDEGQAEPSAEAKAKERRQQVRKAQRQHRQRKANYTKQLEMDITKLRDDIVKVEREVERLKNQNGAIRSQVASGGDQVDVPPPAVVDTMDAAFSTFLAPSYTVSLDMSEYLGTPAYQVRRASSSLSETASSKTATSPRVTEALSGTTPASTVGTGLEDIAMMEATLSEEQIDRAINFILAYEPYPCNRFSIFPSFTATPPSFIPCGCSHLIASMAMFRNNRTAKTRRGLITQRPVQLRSNE
ncbi:hypothetical protein F5B21DRAFT_462791 [Xylaria acuta]|nr:hypothetical protein F5B21DRAFT_462791 [Xylaria acuta]